jgi:GNAT superfamily N-acetyltransferase
MLHRSALMKGAAMTRIRKSKGRRVTVTDEATGKSQVEFLTDDELETAFFPIRRDESWEDISGDLPQGVTPNALTYRRSGTEGCLGAYDAGGELVGALCYHFATGEIDIHVRREKRRQGFAKKLLIEAMLRWRLDLTKQLLTTEGSYLRDSIAVCTGQPANKSEKENAK